MRYASLVKAVAAVLAPIILTVSAAHADCDCGSTDPANPCYGTTASRQVGPATVTFNFNADGDDCACGRFVNGDVWVAPLKKSGGTAAAVTITGITPAGENNGAHSNLSNRGTSQGLLPRWDNYSVSDNIMTKLPYAAAPGEVILKAVERPSATCGTGATQARSCADAFDALTVLAEVPEDCGATLFRPPYAGTEKPLRSIHNVQWDRLPEIATISAHPFKETFGNIAAMWSVPTCDIIREGGQEIYRAFTAHGAVGSDYAADVAYRYLGHLLSVFGTEPDSQKAAAVYALLQPGFDNYEVYKLGHKFSSGAGQHLGKKPQIVFAAALYDEPEMLEAIRGASVNAEEGWFQEDKQIRYVEGQSTTPVWGDGNPADDDYQYWIRFGYNSNDNVKTMRDPYGYIDGPAHGIHGATYQWCCSTGPFAGFAFAQHLMPWMEYANNDWELTTYVDRAFNGRGIDGFGGGWWGQPDPCAPKTDSAVKGVDYGPDSTHPGDCIRDTDSTDGIGRFPGDHGTKFSPSTWGRLPKLALGLWMRFRDCADPDNPAYPCAGMGPEVSFTGINRVAPRPDVLPGLSVAPNPVRNRAVFTRGTAPLTEGTVISIYAGNGMRLIRQLQADIPGFITWDGFDEAGKKAKPGVYFYLLKNTDGSTVPGRFMKVSE